MAGFDKLQVWRVVGNTDLTEGRGRNFTKAYCAVQATAMRIAKGGYVQGSNCPVEKAILWRRCAGEPWMGPVHIEQPTNEDRKHQEHLDEIAAQKSAKEAAIERARAAGLSDADLEALRS